MKEQRDGNAQESKVQAAREQVQSACKKARREADEIRGQEVCKEDGESRSKKAGGQIGEWQ